MTHVEQRHSQGFGLTPAILIALAIVACASPGLARTPELIAAMGHRWGKTQATEGLRQLIPLGSSEQALVRRLRHDGFHLGKPRRDGARFARAYQGGGNIACTDIYTVTWRADAEGRVLAIDGDVEGSC